jgi:hypothetical protein
VSNHAPFQSDGRVQEPSGILKPLTFIIGNLWRRQDKEQLLKCIMIFILRIIASNIQTILKHYTIETFSLKIGKKLKYVQNSSFPKAKSP